PVRGDHPAGLLDPQYRARVGRTGARHRRCPRGDLDRAMRDTFRQSMSWLHTYCGLFFGWVLFGILLTGSIAVFYTEVSLWAAPEVHAPVKIDRERAIATGRAYLTEQAP